jgi:hypothetical protein
MERLRGWIAWVKPIDTLLAVSNPVAMKAAIHSAAQMGTADVGSIRIGATKVYPTEITNMGAAAAEVADASKITTTKRADVATADAADVATTDAAADSADVATTDAATRSEGSRWDCGAAHKNGGDRCHHHLSEHRSLHSHIYVAPITGHRPTGMLGC